MEIVDHVWIGQSANLFSGAERIIRIMNTMKISRSLITEMNKNQKAFYLKINRSEDFALRNLSRWIDAAYLAKAACYIVCDREDLVEKIKATILLSESAVFIKSSKPADMETIVNQIASRNWINAAYAHLTTFWHAEKMGYDYFWNIDADDTQLCVSADRTQELLQCVERYAEENQIDCFSLDMWSSRFNGTHWSFGITYTKVRSDWQDLLLQRCGDEEYKQFGTDDNNNVDWFFTYLKTCTNLRIETFYFENLKFIHYSNDFFLKPVGSGFYHWKEGKLLYPILYYCFGMKELGLYPIASDVIKLDIQIQDDEAKDALSYYARDSRDLNEYSHWENIVNEELSRKKMELYVKQHCKNKELICFGAGHCLQANYEKIHKVASVRYVCDNNANLWGKEMGNGMTCISPKQLGEMQDVFVIIMVYGKIIAAEIASQLTEMGIAYDYAENWLRCAD